MLATPNIDSGGGRLVVAVRLITVAARLWKERKRV
jgi:hypothetical protein